MLTNLFLINKYKLESTGLPLYSVAISVHLTPSAFGL